MTTDEPAMRLTIGQLASRCNVARTTILYYEQVGLLAPVARSEAGHRLYSEHQLERVRQICAYRATGLTLDVIRAVLAGGDTTAAITRRLDDIAQAMLRLREQQVLLVGMLGADAVPLSNEPALAELVQSTGLDDAAMHRWHVVFARQNPEAHRAFLRSLGMSEQEVARIADMQHVG